MTTIIQRSVSERSREKCNRGSRGISSHVVTECRHRTPSRKHRECRHSESKLRQQARLEYVQSSPNVATIHNSKFSSTNPRGGGICGTSSNSGHHRGASGSVINRGGIISSRNIVGGSGSTIGVSGSTNNLSKMYSAVSDGELLDLDILPIFQKLLNERHKSTTRSGSYGANIASCPNISIKCDIVEYL